MSATRSTCRPTDALSRRAFTLLEMVVVVGIMIILASLAVRSMDGVDQQTRFEATQRCMRDVSDAVLSVGRDADGTTLISGFVADMGRLPLAVGTDPNYQLQELWLNPANLRPLAVRSPACDPEVLLATGWRGSYLRLGVGQSALRDGWGKALDLFTPAGATPAPGVPIAAARSRGANGLVDPIPPANAYDADIPIQLGASSASSVTDPCKAAISGRVFRLDPKTSQLRDPNAAEGDVTILFFGPDPDPAKDGFAVHTVTVSATDPAPFATVAFSFPQETPGPRVIRAYQGKPVTAGVWSTAPIRSVPVRLMLQPGGQTKDLILR